MRLSSDSDSDGQGKGKAKERGSPGRDEREESARLPSLTALEEHSSRLREMAKLSGWQPKVGSELEKVMSGRSDELRVEDDHREVNGGGGKAGGVNGVAKDKPTRGPRPPSSPGDITDPYDNYKGPPHSRLKNLASTSAAATRTPTSAAAKLKRSNSSTAKKRTPAAAPTPSPPEDEPIPFMDPLPAAPPADFWGVGGGARPAATKGKKRAHGEKVRDDTSLLKKTLKRREKAKKKSESEWKERKDGVAKGQAMKQKRREENLKKRSEEKGGKGKKKGGAKGGAKPKAKMSRPGFEGSFTGKKR